MNYHYICMIITFFIILFQNVENSDLRDKVQNNRWLNIRKMTLDINYHHN